MTFRAIETGLVSIFALYETLKGYREFKAIKFDDKDLNTDRILSSQRRTYLLVILTLVFGAEIGFKLQNRQVVEKGISIFLSNRNLGYIPNEPVSCFYNHADLFPCSPSNETNASTGKG